VGSSGTNILKHNNMKVIFLAYRKWALDVFPSVEKHPKVSEIILCTSHEDLIRIELTEYDLIVSCGWSEELGPVIVSKIEAIGVHCAELDRYSYGTPIQLQIIDGITNSKHRIFSFTYDENSSRAHTHNRHFSHEVHLDLTGNMDDILEQMTVTSKALFNMYLNDYPNIKWQEWPAEEIVRPKRKAEDSKLTKEQLAKMTTEELYNFFRCLEEPYPNGYIEDEKGKLFIKQVSYKKYD
jgi:methionyl-tRNA formyltransferase